MKQDEGHSIQSKHTGGKIRKKQNEMHSVGVLNQVCVYTAAKSNNYSKLPSILLYIILLSILYAVCLYYL